MEYVGVHQWKAIAHLESGKKIWGAGGLGAPLGTAFGESKNNVWLLEWKLLTIFFVFHYSKMLLFWKVSESKEGSFATNTFRGLHGAFIVADIAKPETFHSVGKFRQIIDEKVSSAGGMVRGYIRPSSGPASCTPSTSFGYPSLYVCFQTLYVALIPLTLISRGSVPYSFFVCARVFMCASRLSRE